MDMLEHPFKRGLGAIAPLQNINFKQNRSAIFSLYSSSSYIIALLEQTKEDAIPTQAIQQLSQTLYACSSLSPLLIAGMATLYIVEL